MQKDQNIKRLSGTSYVIPLDQKPIGKGSFGEVFKVFDLNRKEVDLAVKIMRRENKQMEKSVLREIKNIEQLPYCINLVNYEKFCLQSKNNHYFIMEYCNGGDLYQQIHQCKRLFSEQEIIEFLAQFINGYLHLLSHGIVHRDIKPQNILIHNNLYKICDFGLSKKIEFEPEKELANNLEFLQFSLRPGTPYYQAPDVMKKSYSGENLDVFSLGVILYQLLFFSGSSLQLNNTQQNHPLLNLEGIREKKEFHSRLRNLGQQNNSHLDHLDQLIESSDIKRSKQITDLMKQMLEINSEKRITFKQLSEDSLIKKELQQIDNYKVQEFRAQQMLNGADKVDLTNQLLQSEIQMMSSDIMNLDKVQQAVLKESIKICEIIEEERKKDNMSSDNSYYTQKRQHFQKLFDQLKQDQSGKGGKQIKNPSMENSTNKTQTLLGIKLPELANNHKTSEDAKSEDGEGEEEKNSQAPNNKQDQSFDYLLRESVWRIQKQCRIKQIEDSLIFFREAAKVYEKAAIQLSKSYYIVKSGQVSQILSSMFDEISLLSLILYKQQIQRLTLNSESILLDSSLGISSNQNIQNEGQQKDNPGKEDFVWFDEVEIKEFEQSNERQVFLTVIQQDILNVNLLLDSLIQSRSSIKCIYSQYFGLITSQNELQKNYKDKIRDLIKLGIEEYGLLEEKNCLQFQRTLLLLTEVDVMVQNQAKFYKKYQFNKGKLVYRIEQISQGDKEISLELASYCDQNKIKLIAVSD